MITKASKYKSIRELCLFHGLLSFARQFACLPVISQGHVLYFPWERSIWILYCCGTLCFITSLWFHSQSACTGALLEGKLQEAREEGFFSCPLQGSWHFTPVMRSCVMKHPPQRNTLFFLKESVSTNKCTVFRKWKYQEVGW